MPLLDRPTSINTYALSKIWYRASSINFKVGDIDTMQSKIKSWLNQDTFEKPQEEILYRKKRRWRPKSNQYKIQNESIPHNKFSTNGVQ